MERLPKEDVRGAVERALAEDVGSGDVTTLGVIEESVCARGAMVAREPMVVAGLPVVQEVYRQIDPDVRVRFIAQDGNRVQEGQTLLELAGSARGLLTGERVALNFLQRLSGVATLTRQYVDAVAQTNAVILDTRKTTPGLRSLEKYAVRCGGGVNHRFGLHDAILIKDNHLVALQQTGVSAIALAVRRCREKYPHLTVEVEADTLDQVTEALDAGADTILLDNMNPVQLRLAAQHARGRARTEASGGVHLGTVLRIAESGVDFISVGALTHSARSVDIALDFLMEPGVAKEERSDD